MSTQISGNGYAAPGGTEQTSASVEAGNASYPFTPSTSSRPQNVGIRASSIRARG